MTLLLPDMDMVIDVDLVIEENTQRKVATA